MTILITGATGHFGRLAIDALIARGVSPADIVAGARTPSNGADLAARGIGVVHLDYTDPDSVAAAFAGVDRVLLVSSSEIGQRTAQHRVVIDAARDASVSLIAYTSIVDADDNPIPLAPEHVETEALIAESGLPAVILRNDWYSENYLTDIDTARASGEVTASTRHGRVASAARADYAEAAAIVLIDSDAHAGRTYELAGETSWDYDELAATLGRLLGRDVEFRNLEADEHVAALQAVGLDLDTAGFVAAIDAGIAAGGLDHPSETLATLIGRPTTSLEQTLAAAINA